MESLKEQYFGPLLFIIFSNSFATQPKNSEFIQYEDNTVIYLSHKDAGEISRLLNEDLESISNYFYENEAVRN